MELSELLTWFEKMAVHFGSDLKEKNLGDLQPAWPNATNFSV